jgi:hypothetical protein
MLKPTDPPIHFIPSPRFWSVQGFLLLVWVAFSFLLQKGVTPVGVDYTGLLYWNAMAVSMIGLLWVYAGYVWVALRYPPHTRFRILETGLLLLFFAAMIGLQRSVFSVDMVTMGSHATHFQHGLWLCERLGGEAQLGLYTASDYAVAPPVGGLLFALVRFLSFRLFSLPLTYLITVGIAYVLFVMLLYLAARRCFGRFSSMSLLGVLLIDAGSDLLSFRQFALDGDWVFGLGLALALYALSVWCDWETSSGNRRYLLGGLCSAMSILCSPFFAVWQLTCLLILCVGFSIGHLMYSVQGCPYPHARGLIWTVLSIALGLGLAAFYWMPLSDWYSLIVSTETERINLAVRGEEIIQGTLFPGSLPGLVYLGMAGIVWGLFSGKRFAKALSILCLFSLFMGTAVGQMVFSIILRSVYVGPDRLGLFPAVSKGLVILLVAGVFGFGVRMVWDRTRMNERLVRAGQWIWHWKRPSLSHVLHHGVSDLSRTVMVLLFGLPLFALGRNVIVAIYRGASLSAAAVSAAPSAEPMDVFMQAIHIGEAQMLPVTDVLPRNITLLSTVLLFLFFFWKTGWTRYWHESSVNHWIARLVCVVALVGLGYGIVVVGKSAVGSSSMEESSLSFLGITTDDVGRIEREPDGIADLELSLSVVSPIAISEYALMELYELNRSGDILYYRHWSTLPGDAWKVAVTDESGTVQVQASGKVVFPMSQVQNVRLHIANPYPDYIPREFRVRCIVHLAGGETMTWDSARPGPF